MRRVLRPLSARGIRRHEPWGNGRRLLLIQLDGVSRGRLEKELAAGRLPHLKKLLDRRGLSLSGCHSGAPASTPAFQAGLFYGISPSVPGFVWWDRAER